MRKRMTIISTWVYLFTASLPTPDTEYHQMLVTWHATTLYRLLSFGVGEGQNNSLSKYIVCMLGTVLVSIISLTQNMEHWYTRFFFTIQFKRSVVHTDKTWVFYFPIFQADLSSFNYLFKTWSYKICPWEVSFKFPYNLMQFVSNELVLER